MKQSTYTTRVLEPSEGYKLTEAADVPVADRTISDKVYLAATASEDDWREIPETEAEEILAEKKRLAEEGTKDAENQ